MTSRIGITYRMRWGHAVIAAALLAAAFAVLFAGGGSSPADAVGAARSLAAPAPASAPADPTAIDPHLRQLAARRAGASAEVIVQFDGSVAPAARRQLVAAAGGRVTRELHIIPGLGARMPAAKAVKLGGAAGVRAVSLNAAIKPQSISTTNLMTTFPKSSHAANAWNKRDNTGVTGKGVGVAVIDTGVAGDLVDFQGADGNSRVVESAVTNPDATTATDRYGHGTHVAGIIAGNSWARPAADPLRGDYIGVAPDANLVSIKASDDAGGSTVLDVIYALQFAVDHKADYNLRVVNLSLDSTTAQSYKVDPLDAAAEAAWFHGLVVVAAAGNRGTDADAVNYAPANDPYVITVGAYDENGTAGPLDDTIADWSSRGTTQDGFAKPDLYAPGSRIVSNLAPDSVFTTLCPTCVFGGGQYIRAGGTSMAAPMVAGAVAVVLEGHPSWTPDQVKAALKLGANTLGGPGGVKTLEVNRTNDANPTTPANQGLTPNTLIDPSTGDIDYTRSSWSRSSWSEATDLLRSSWSRSSWSRSSWSSTDSSGVETSRSSWSRSSWSTSVYK